MTEQTITQQHRDELDELGFTVFYNVIDPEWLDEMRATFEQLIEQEGDQAGIEVGVHSGIRRLADLVNKGSIFDRIYTHPIVLLQPVKILSRRINGLICAPKQKPV